LLKAFIMHVEFRDAPPHKHLLGQALRDNERVVPERCEEFAQHLRLFSVLCHAIHFSLKFAGSDWRCALICDKL
jgi:hypothetical protein